MLNQKIKIISQQGMMGKVSAFSLVEMLVVVIIIAVMAKIALPTFRKTIWQARFAEVARVTGAIAEAERRYYTKHGYYPIHLYNASGCSAGRGYPATTASQVDLQIQIPNNSYFNYLIYPSETYTTAYGIYFRINSSACWCYTYDYEANCWWNYSAGCSPPSAAGDACQYFIPPGDRC